MGGFDFLEEVMINVFKYNFGCCVRIEDYKLRKLVVELMCNKEFDILV